MFSFWKRQEPEDSSENAASKEATRLWAKGSGHLERKNYKRAAAVMREALQLEPSRLEGRLNLGAALYLLGENEEAMTHFKYVLAFDPQNTMALLNLAASQDKSGDLDGSVRTLEALVENRPNWRDAHYNLGVALFKQKNYEKAAEALKAELRLNPEHILARDLLNEIHLMPPGRKAESVEAETTDTETAKNAKTKSAETPIEANNTDT
jgi:tetratricopeptide (TPR) repeat protein